MNRNRRIREAAVVIVETAVDGSDVRPAPKPGQRAQGRTGSTRVRRVDAEVLRVALERAGGDYRRLRFLEDGSVLVANAPR